MHRSTLFSWQSQPKVSIRLMHDSKLESIKGQAMASLVVAIPCTCHHRVLMCSGLRMAVGLYVLGKGPLP